MLEWGLGFLEGLAGFVRDPAGTVAGWTWDKVTAGIFQWLAQGLALLLEWVWGMLDAGTTPRLTQHWFANRLAARVGVLGLAVVVAMMLASAIQAALAGRPEQIGDAVKEAARAIVASALTVTVVDRMIGITDEAADAVWRLGRGDLVVMIEEMVAVTVGSAGLAATFVGPLCLLFGFVGLLGLSVSMLMRSALIYLVAAMAPLVWSASVLPVMRDSSRRLVHLLVALVVSKLAIVISLVVAVQLGSNAGRDPDISRPDLDAGAAVGTLVTGFACFLVAALSPMVLYRLMPTVEGAVASAGVVGGWGRAGLSLGQAAVMARSLGVAAAATRAVAGQHGVAGDGNAGDGGGPHSQGGASGGAGRAVTGLAAATRAARAQAGAGVAGEGAGDRAAGSGDGGGDPNLPPMPPAADGESEPAPWALPGAAADGALDPTPRYSTQPAPTPDPCGGDRRSGTAGEGGLPPLPSPGPERAPWVPPGTPASGAGDGGRAGGGR